ncbi:hypothetical protein BJ546DRAFT_97942 [Cryomyces antarcticus]
MESTQPTYLNVYASSFSCCSSHRSFCCSNNCSNKPRFSRRASAADLLSRCLHYRYTVIIVVAGALAIESRSVGNVGNVGAAHCAGLILWPYESCSGSRQPGRSEHRFPLHGLEFCRSMTRCTALGSGRCPTACAHRHFPHATHKSDGHVQPTAPPALGSCSSCSQTAKGSRNAMTMS